MALLCRFLYELRRGNSIAALVRHVGRPGMGFVLVVVSLVFAVAAQAQTEESGSTPTLTLASSHASATKGEDITFTLTADSAPASDTLVYVQVQVTIRERSVYQSKVLTLSLASGERTIELIADTGSDAIGTGVLTLDVSILGGSGYRMGATPIVGVRVTDATPTPTAGAATGPGAPPSAPVGFAASAEAGGSIAASWDKLAGVAHYRLEEQLGSLGVVMWKVVRGHGRITKTAVTVDGLNAGTRYQYRVRAYGDGESSARVWGEPSTSASATTSGSQARAQTVGSAVVRAAPSPPSWRTVTALDYKTIDAVWTRVTGANCYRFGIWLGNPGGWEFKTTDRTSYTWTDRIARGTTYNLRVAAAAVSRCTDDQPAEWSLDAWATVTTPRPTPQAPSGFSGSATDTRSIEASWSRVPGASKYEFGIYTGNPGSWKTKEVLRPTTSTTWTGLAPGTTYEIRVRAHGDGSFLAAEWGPYSEEEVTTEAPTPVATTPPQEQPPAPPPVLPPAPPPALPPAPPPSAPCDPHSVPPSTLPTPVVEVIPKSERKADLRWEMICHADQYVVEVSKQGSGAWSKHRRSMPHTTSTSIEIELDNIMRDMMGDKGLADDPYAYQFRVKAVDISVNPNTESDYSDTVILIDTPITRADGNSPAGGQAALTRTAIEDLTIQGKKILGASYAGGTYSFRYRSLGVDKNRDSHTGLDWEPDNPLKADTTSDNPITGLTLYEVYAIQLIYETPSGERVYAARDVYVWPSDRPAGNGERVATFPLRYRLANKTYYYRICENSFPQAIRTDLEAYIDHAFSQWEIATDDWVSFEHDESLNCEYYLAYLTPIRENIQRLISDPAGRPSDAVIEAHVTGLLSQYRDVGIITPARFARALAHSREEQVSEIYMIDDESLNISVALIQEISTHVGHGWCRSICTTTDVTYNDDGDQIISHDIKVRSSYFEGSPLMFPGIDKVASKDDIRFNACPWSSPSIDWLRYKSLVHEAGHALGIGYGTDGMGQDRHHPQIEDALMSYSTPDDYDCSPHPFDIMAIFALYQTIP